MNCERCDDIHVCQLSGGTRQPCECTCHATAISYTFTATCAINPNTGTNLNPFYYYKDELEANK